MACATVTGIVQKILTVIIFGKDKLKSFSS